ncbi:MAG: response regulator [Candidatus Eremiobacteraeota bacterium]|nr:response regulator [Candidatus Eremiobacteraeota bacterium]
MPETIVIAVVDDDASMREAVTGLLKSAGFSSIAFERGEDFLNSDHRRSAACLIADVQMPEMSGPELHSRLAASGERIPTILITAYPDENVRTRALRAGVKFYLTKPFDDEDFLARVRSALDSPAADGEQQQRDDT